MERTNERGSAGEAATLRLVQDHAAELLRFARRFSLCADDAHDAYQRGIEILVRRMRTDPPDRPLSWVRSVIRNEAARVRVEREELVGRVEVDVDLQPDRDAEDPSERVAGFERLGRVAEALQRLKSQEVTALVLRAEGLTYEEICARTGWTYTKTNRCVTEGRRALIDRLGAIESGAECDRWLPQLSRLADGEATPRQLSELRPHLRACPACRATLRQFHDAPRQVAALVPVAAVPLAAGDPAPAIGHLEAVAHALVDRVTLAATRLQGAFDTLPGAKVAAVAASTAALAGSGAAIEHAARAQAPVDRAAHVVAGAPSGGAGGGGLVVATPLPAPPASGAARSDPAPAGEFAVEAAVTTPAEFAASPSQPAAAQAAVVSPPTATTPGSASATTSGSASATTSGSASATTSGSASATASRPPARARPPAEFAGP